MSKYGIARSGVKVVLTAESCRVVLVAHCVAGVCKVTDTSSGYLMLQSFLQILVKKKTSVPDKSLKGREFDGFERSLSTWQ
jgi:hypothetical protein